MDSQKNATSDSSLDKKMRTKRTLIGKKVVKITLFFVNNFEIMASNLEQERHVYHIMRLPSRQSSHQDDFGLRSRLSTEIFKNGHKFRV